MSTSTTDSPILPITASADGRLNRHYIRCEVVSHGMSYAACLSRQSVLSKSDIKTPADWSGCADAARCGKCKAAVMREEELLHGRSIYFTPMRTQTSLKKEAWELHQKEYGTTSPAPAREVQPVVRRSTVTSASPPASAVSREIAMPAADGGYADVINSMLSSSAHAGPPALVVTAPHAGPPALVKPIGTAPVALPGESPLALARRLAAERAAAAAA